MSITEIEILQNFIAKSSLHRMMKYSKNFNFKIESVNLNENKTDYFGDKISIIMLWGTIGSFVLKIHFDSNSAVTLASHAMKKLDQDTNSEMAYDFMKEFCNLQASYIKGFIENHKLMFGMSLPFLADGTDEVIFRKIRDPRAKYSAFRVSDGEISMVLTTEIFLLEREPIKAIQNFLINSSNEDSDDVQFF
jgi:CheY-specific phosphatase CheX